MIEGVVNFYKAKELFERDCFFVDDCDWVTITTITRLFGSETARKGSNNYIGKKIDVGENKSVLCFSFQDFKRFVSIHNKRYINSVGR